MSQKHRSYKEDLLADLRDPEYAANYLSACMDESVETFLLALRDVADAQKGMSKVAAQAKVNRENLYRMLSKEGNPRLRNLQSVVNALGFKINFERESLATTVSKRKRRPTDITIAQGVTNVGTQIQSEHSSAHSRVDRRQINVHRLYGQGTIPGETYGVAIPATL